ncbi:hypothetical protein [Flavobacterium sp. FlaQc-30]|uniref:hypothetical protein n=1 Tax=Flavobacterium sp. FlaQc-30 TaxID=3374179 RepID=UPI0037578FDF
MDIDLTKWKLVKTGQIEDEFEGFDEEMIFELTDGTVYYQSAYKYRYHYAYRPTVKIYSDGYTKIIVPNGMNDYAKIQETTAIKSKIINDFKGWSGDTIFELQNGQIWKQDKHKYKYFYSYRPNAIIIKTGSHYIMTVKGKSIRVKRIK